MTTNNGKGKLPASYRRGPYVVLAVMMILVSSLLFYAGEVCLTKDAVRAFLLASMNCAATLLAIIVGATIAYQALAQKGPDAGAIPYFVWNLSLAAVLLLLLHIAFAAVSYIICNDKNAIALLRICSVMFGLSILVFMIFFATIVSKLDIYFYEKGWHQSDDKEDK